MTVIKLINYIFITTYILSSIYQLLVLYFVKEKNNRKCKKHKFAILIAARNEEKVIGNLIDSIKLQEYPKELIDIFVVADNCTDSTANIARKKEIFVFERYNNEKIGKGYALDFLINKIKDKYKNNKYDAFIVLDADNLIDKNFIYEINKIYSEGYEVVTSFRNSKNYGDNWVSAGSSTYFLHTSMYAKYKMNINSDCTILGTGYLFSNKILEFYGYWKFYSITEDLEFTINNKQNNIKIGYSDLSIVYDEQPSKLFQFWNQRLRWTIGSIQLYKRNVFKKKIKIKDLVPDTLTVATSLMIINFIGILIITIKMCIDLEQGGLTQALKLFINSYCIVFLDGVITTIVEWKRIKTKNIIKIKYIFTYPILILCYIPIIFISLFKKNIIWKNIEHDDGKSIKEFL